MLIIATDANIWFGLLTEITLRNSKVNLWMILSELYVCNQFKSCGTSDSASNQIIKGKSKVPDSLSTEGNHK